jgi:hypothetical protein
LIYIDNLKTYSKKPSGKRFAHMIAANKEELHNFALICSIKRHFYHANPYPHYDVSETHYGICRINGAIKVTTRELIQKIKENENEQINARS